MSACGRSSKTSSQNETLVGRVGAAGVAGAGTARIRMTGQGWVGAGEARLEVRSEGAGPEGRDAESSGIKIGGDDGVVEGNVRLEVKVGWVVSCLRTT